MYHVCDMSYEAFSTTVHVCDMSHKASSTTALGASHLVVFVLQAR